MRGMTLLMGFEKYLKEEFREAYEDILDNTNVTCLNIKDEVDNSKEDMISGKMKVKNEIEKPKKVHVLGRRTYKVKCQHWFE